jgi:hypothetical protein
MSERIGSLLKRLKSTKVSEEQIPTALAEQDNSVQAGGMNIAFP